MDSLCEKVEFQKDDPEFAFVHKYFHHDAPCSPFSTSSDFLTIDTLMHVLDSLLNKKAIRENTQLCQFLKNKTDFLITINKQNALEGKNLIFYNELRRLVSSSGKINAVFARNLVRTQPLIIQTLPDHTTFPKKTSPLSMILSQISNKIPNTAFGKAQWERYFGDVGVEPPLPKDIPYDKKLHVLTLIPETIDGKLLTLDLVGELVKSPKNGGNATGYNQYCPSQGSMSVYKSYWVLMSKNVMPNSERKSYSEQLKLLPNGFESPYLIDVVVSILMHYVHTKERLLIKKKRMLCESTRIYTKCQKEYLLKGCRTIIGGFSDSGLNFGKLNIINNNNDLYGLCYSRRFN